MEQVNNSEVNDMPPNQMAREKEYAKLLRPIEFREQWSHVMGNSSPINPHIMELKEQRK